MSAQYALRPMKNRKSTVSSAMSVLGRIGAYARAEALSPRRKRQIAKLAAAASAKVRTAKARARRRKKGI